MRTFNLAGVDAPAQPPTPGSVNWSPQQTDVFDEVKNLGGGSLRVDAVAGSGKTTTLVHAAGLMDGRVAFGAFNKKIADEIKVRVAHHRNITAGTMHSFGLRAWTAMIGQSEIDGRKLDNIMDVLRVPYELHAFTKACVSAIKGNGIPLAEVTQMQLITYCDHFDFWEKLPESFDRGDRDPFEWVRPLLEASNDRAHEGYIDFDDMLYMPLTYGRIEAEYDWVLIDEAQDTNWVRRQLAARLLKPGGRCVAVGDPHQAIYGFTGADADAMDLITSQFQCKFMPLTVTYRCPKKVVEFARQWVSHITAADSAPDGEVSLKTDEEWGELLRDASNFTANDAILCRNTKPIVGLALSMIRRGIGARVEGREIGQQLNNLIRRFKTARNLNDLQSKLEGYLYKETKKLNDRGQKQKAAELTDKVDSLVAVIESVRPSGDIPAVTQRITSLFGDTEPGRPARVCTLSTVHKAKGREWERVYLLGRETLMPSKWARQDWELQQEKNLIYVAATRAKKQLIEVPYDA